MLSIIIKLQRNHLKDSFHNYNNPDFLLHIFCQKRSTSLKQIAVIDFYNGMNKKNVISFKLSGHVVPSK